MRKLALAFTWVILAIPCQARVIYVDSNTPDNNDGSRWAKAYKYLQDGLADANSDPCLVEIRVADGTYYPDANTDEPNGSGDREATFQLGSGIALYGGYAGDGAADPNARDIELYKTILSGDLDGNDTPGLDPCDLLNDPNRGENSYHVVTGSGTDATAIIGGFTITAGHANEPYVADDHRCYGGGMYNDSGSPTVTNCIFIENLSSFGGGLFNKIGANAEISKCTFNSNYANDGGGGIYNRNSSSPEIINCVFMGNLTRLQGGGIRNFDYCDPSLTNCTFSGNSADFRGGGMYNYNSSPTVTNCTFSGNSADNGGGGMYNSDSDPNLTNCILWGNTASDGNEIMLVSLSTIDINYCDIKDGNDGIYKEGGCTVNWGNDNIVLDPLFADGLRLSVGSPCIDVGDNNAVGPDNNDIDNDGNTTEPIPWDLDERPRFADGDCNTTDIVDMGAYEFNWTYIGDFAGGCDVDFIDFSVFALTWLLEDGQPGYNNNCDISLPVDGIIDERDLDIFTDNWLEGF